MVKGLVILVCAASAVSMLISLASRSAPQVKGWRHLNPGPLYWTGVILGSGLSLLMGYVRLFVGSTRPDAETQMNILTGLIIAFGGLTIATAIQLVQLKRQSMRWRGNAIVHSTGKGEVKRYLEDITNVYKRPFGHIVITFSDGTSLRLDPYATNASELLERIAGLQAET